MMSIARHIPNALTGCNLLSGCIGIALVFGGNPLHAALWLWAGALFDFLDGLVARLVKSSTEFGKELDSLADVVTFGVLPSSILFHYLYLDTQSGIAYAAWALALFSALRLAKFNTDPRQQDQFLGLPTPASGIFVSSLPLVEYEYPQLFDSFAHEWALLAGTAVLCLLLVLPLPMISLKFARGGWGPNRLRVFFLLASIVLLLTFGVAGIPMVIIFYVILSGIFRALQSVTSGSIERDGNRTS